MKAGQSRTDALTDVRRKTEEFLCANDPFLVTAHENADGDAISAVLAFGRLLNRMGKRHYAVLSDRSPDPKYRFLPDFATIRGFGSDKARDRISTNVVVLDTPNTERMGRVAEWIGKDVTVINIDHHESNEYFGDLNLIDPRASATTQMICEIADDLGIEPDAEMATHIYTGIMFDTGRFRFANTSPVAFRMCGRMVECGAEPAEIANAVYAERPMDSMHALAGALSTLELHLGGRVSSMHLEDGRITEDTDVEGIADYGISVAGVEASLFIREYAQNDLRVNLRSRGRVNVSNVARTFNGGGHPNAAGCRIQGDLHEVKRALIAEIEKHLPSMSE